MLQSESSGMTFADRQADGLARAKLVGRWDRRIKKTGMSRSQFCDKHKLDKSQICRHIKGGIGPCWDAVRKVERALEKEDV